MDYSVVEFGKGTLRYCILGPIIIVGYSSGYTNELYRDWPKLKIGRWNWIVSRHHTYVSATTRPVPFGFRHKKTLFHNISE